MKYFLTFAFCILHFAFFLCGCLTLDSSTKQDEVAQIRSSVSEEIIRIKQDVDSIKGQLEELQYEIDKIQKTQSQQSNEINTTLKEWEKKSQSNVEKKIQHIEEKQAQDKKELQNKLNIVIEEVTKENKELRSQIEAIRKSGRTTAEEGYYVVSPGDTLSKIAQMYGVSIKDIMETNNITDSNSIRTGQKLIIPQKK